MTSIVYREYLKYIRIMRRLTLITRSCHEVWSIRWTARDLLPNNLRLNLNVLFSSSLEFLPHTCTTIYSEQFIILKGAFTIDIYAISIFI